MQKVQRIKQCLKNDQVRASLNILFIIYHIKINRWKELFFNLKEKHLLSMSAKYTQVDRGSGKKGRWARLHKVDDAYCNYS